MKTLAEMLKPYVGRYVGVQVLKGQSVVSMAGQVEEHDNEEIVFLRERTTQPGQPKMAMGPAGPSMLPGEEKIIPRSVIHLGNITEEDVIMIEETTETPEEAAAALGSKDEGMIKPAGAAAAARFGAASGFMPAR